MSTMKLLFCAACLCSAGVFVKSAMTQEKKIAPPVSPLKEGGEKQQPAGLRAKLPPDVEAAFYGGPVGGLAAPASGFGRFIGRVPPGVKMESDTPLRPRAVRRTVLETVFEPIPPEEIEAMQKLQAAIQQLKNGGDDAARTAATETIQQQLTTQFEADLKQREKELAEVEQRVKSLREQLDKRKAAQADIINLRLQTLINDANGLGFPDTGFAAGEPMVQDRAWAPLYQPGRTDETDAPSYDPGQKDSDVFSRDAVPESLQPLKPPLE